MKRIFMNYSGTSDPENTVQCADQYVLPYLYEPYRYVDFERGSAFQPTSSRYRKLLKILVPLKTNQH
jgi:hypothetical protein